MKTKSEIIISFELFIKKFHCSANELKKKGYTISCRKSNALIIGTSQNLVHKKFYSENLAAKEHHFYLLPNINSIHPIEYIAAGHYAFYNDPFFSIEMKFGFGETILSEQFFQGFYNNPDYKNQWRGSFWDRDAAFELGRIMHHKYVGRNLGYTIPKELAHIKSLIV